MVAMNTAAKTDRKIAKRIHLFRYRVPEEFYDLQQDPDCLINLIDNPEYNTSLQKMRKRLEEWMVQTGDPMLEAFRNRDDRAIVDEVIKKTYGRKAIRRGKARKATNAKPAN